MLPAPQIESSLFDDQTVGLPFVIGEMAEMPDSLFLIGQVLRPSTPPWPPPQPIAASMKNIYDGSWYEPLRTTRLESVRHRVDRLTRATPDEDFPQKDEYKQ